MPRSSKQFRGYSIAARDGQVGTLSDCLFDDVTWYVRFLVVDTGSWLSGRRVVITPRPGDRVDWPGRRIVVGLTCAQVNESPDADTQRPVSRQHTSDVYTSSRLPPVAASAGWWAPGLYLPEASLVEPELDETLDRHLRSTDEVCGYRIEAVDGDAGRVVGFGVDDTGWAIRYLVVGLAAWWPRKRVLIESRRVDHISWADRSVLVALTKRAIEGAPLYDASKPVSSADAARVAEHFDDEANWRAPDLNRK